MKISPRWMKVGLGGLGIAGLLGGGIGMSYDAAPAGHHATGTHSAMSYDHGEGWTAHLAMSYDGNKSKMSYD